MHRKWEEKLPNVLRTVTNDEQIQKNTYLSNYYVGHKFILNHRQLYWSLQKIFFIFSRIFKTHLKNAYICWNRLETRSSTKIDSNKPFLAIFNHTGASGEFSKFLQEFQTAVKIALINVGCWKFDGNIP